MTIDEKLDLILQELSSLKQRMTMIEMTLENETNKNIMVVAEGHLDLSRKLDNAINLANSIDSKMEHQQLKINKQESEINKIIAQIANGNRIA